MYTKKWVSILSKQLSRSFAAEADTKFYQNQTKAHPPNGMIKP
jgi:hypothetical protein